MGARINYLTIPDELAQRVVKEDLSFWDLALYALENHYIDEEKERRTNKQFTNSLFRERFEDVHHTTFDVFYVLYKFIFAEAAIPFIDGRQPYTEEDAKTNLKTYVEYSASFLTFEDINRIYNQLINLSFEDFVKIKFGEGGSSNSKAIDFVASNGFLIRENVMQDLSIAENYYNEFVKFIDKLIKLEDKQKLGLFITIN